MKIGLYIAFLCLAMVPAYAQNAASQDRRDADGQAVAGLPFCFPSYGEATERCELYREGLTYEIEQDFIPRHATWRDTPGLIPNPSVPRKSASSIGSFRSRPKGDFTPFLTPWPVFSAAFPVSLAASLVTLAVLSPAFSMSLAAPLLTPAVLPAAFLAAWPVFVAAVLVALPSSVAGF